MKTILLVNPAFDEYSTGLPQAMRRSASAKWSPFRVGIMPLGLATVAALTPASIAVDIWDEAVQGPITAADLTRKPYDLIGVTGYLNHAGRVVELGELFRRCGVPTAAGGPGVSSPPRGEEPTAVSLERLAFEVLRCVEQDLRVLSARG